MLGNDSLHLLICNTRKLWNTEQTALKTKLFVSNFNSWSATLINSDTSASLRREAHASLSTKEPTPLTYDDAKNDLQQYSASTSFEGGPRSRRHRGYAYITEGPSTTCCEGQQPGDLSSRIEVLPEPLPCLVNSFELTPRQQYSTPLLDKPLEAVIGTTPHKAEVGASSCLEERAQMDLGSEICRQPSEETLDQDSRSVLLYRVKDMVHPDWETSFALVSTTRPTPPGSYSLTDGREQEQSLLAAGGGEAGDLQTTGEAPYRMTLDDNPNAVDSLHLEIQRLQARIMSRLRDSVMPEVSILTCKSLYLDRLMEL